MKAKINTQMPAHKIFIKGSNLDFLNKHFERSQQLGFRLQLFGVIQIGVRTCIVIFTAALTQHIFTFCVIVIILPSAVNSPSRPGQRRLSGVISLLLKKIVTAFRAISRKNVIFLPLALSVLALLWNESYTKELITVLNGFFSGVDQRDGSTWPADT